MKRTKTSSRAMRHQNNAAKGITKGNSRYAQKVQGKDQIYGPGCCAHKVTQADIDKVKERVFNERRRNPNWTWADSHA